ncbi:uncharacterized protein LOC132187944 [Corylus avellana]|uniref:uncharacterized protein LOC132187944 n=1 Tax=Corylus avellana TaxID=13451 RepID=UPI00286A6F7B|nr:uncharacterized protein LOC132187944 [Corylus avellana]
MSCFDIRDFSQLVDRASIYEESLKENAAEYADQKRRAQGPGTLAMGAGPAKRMVVGSFPPQRMATGTCYRCSQFGQFSKDCVGKGGAQKLLAPGQVYALVPGESEGGLEVVTSTVPILGFEASILIDSKATHSFVSIMFVRLFRLVVRTLEPGLAVTTPVEKTVVCKRVVCKCPVSICGRQVTLRPWGEGEVTYVGSRVRSVPPTISVVRARKLIFGGGQMFLAFVIALAKEEKKDLQDIPMVRDYPDVFSTDYSRLTLEREVEFGIECVPGTNPTSKAPYRMTPLELKELKEQL